MSSTAVVFLGVIALATILIAVVQVAVVVTLVWLARRLAALGDRVERDIQPLIANATAVSSDAARVSELAVSQMERADELFADVAGRFEQTTKVLQGTLLAPAREARALLAALGAMVGAVREGAAGRSAASAADEDDPLFIG